MGAKQSSPAANGRTRAYSGSDLPSSTSGNSGGNVSRTNAGGGGGGVGGGVRYHAYGASGASGAGTASTSQHLGARARSVGGSGSSGTRAQSGINIPNSSGAYSSQESGGSSSSPEEAADREQQGPRLMIGSLPAHLSPHMFGGKRAGGRDGTVGTACAVDTERESLIRSDTPTPGRRVHRVGPAASVGPRARFR